ncbi:MAG: zinc-ribbon domain containing protein [Actinomycetes bacterium]
MVGGGRKTTPAWMRTGDDALWLVDTSFLMQDGAAGSLERHVIPCLRDRAAQIIIPLPVMRELVKKVNEEATRESAHRGLRIASDLRERGLARAIGSDKDGDFADPIILMVVTRERVSRDVVILTQDRNLAGDLRDLKQQGSVRSKHEIVVLSVSPGGGIAPTRRPAVPGAISKARGNAPTGANPAKEMKFRIAKSPDSSPDAPITEQHPPGTGESVLIGGSAFTLGERLHKEATAEGSVYSIVRSDLVAKIYLAGKMTRHRHDKLCRIIQVRPDIPTVMWPQNLVMTNDGLPCGYVMARSRGKPLATEVFLPGILRSQHPGWDRRNLIAMSASVAQTVASLHSLNIVVGDLNQRNLLVDTTGRTVDFVDSDSFQIEGHPCPVGFVNFLHPRLQGKDLATVLRTEMDDEFALATMIFMILMPGKPPYSQQGGGDPGENIRNRHFPYPIGGGERGSNQPLGPWRMVWSHFPHRLKVAFHDVFSEGKRHRAKDWLAILDEYDRHVEAGHHTDEIFPSTYKGVSAYAAEKFGMEPSTKVYRQEYCKECGDPFVVDDDKKLDDSQWLCRACARTMGKELLCRDCGDSFLWSLDEQADFAQRGYDQPARCKSCRLERTSVTCAACGAHFKIGRSDNPDTAIGPLCHTCMNSRGTRITCRDCSSSFVWSYGEQRYFSERQLDQPTRCLECRAKKKAWL